MNEQIRELAKQAGITTNLDTDYYEKDMNKWVDYFSEKFAELIVQECARVAVFKDSGTISTAEVAGWMAAGRSTAAKMIKDHFGVEE